MKCENCKNRCDCKERVAFEKMLEWSNGAASCSGYEPETMPDKNLTDNDVVKALDICSKSTNGCSHSKYTCEDCYLNGQPMCSSVLLQDTIDLINRLQEEKAEQQSEIKTLKDSNKNLQELYCAEREKVKKAKQKVIYIAKALQTARAEIEDLQNLMVKYNGDFAKQEAENEKLRAEVEQWQGGYMTQKQEIANLEVELKAMRGAANSYRAENERLKEENKILSRNADTAFQDGLNEAQDLYAEQIKSEIKAEAYKEFAERLKERKYLDNNGWSHGEHPYVVEESDIDDVYEELVGEDCEKTI